MESIYLWGAGKKCITVLNAIDSDKCKIRGIIDSNTDMIGGSIFNIPIVGWNEIDNGFDYIIITALAYSEMTSFALQNGINENRIISYFNKDDIKRNKYIKFIDEKQQEIDILNEEVNRIDNQLRQLSCAVNNLPYEIVDGIEKKLYKLPNIENNKKLIKKIVDDGYSLVRFGDGEFEIMAGNERPVFQRFDKKLSERLIEVIKTAPENLLIAIADNYGNLDKYTDNSKKNIRYYMKDDTRRFHMTLLSDDREYYDAYVFKLCGFNSKEEVNDRIEDIKKIWAGREVILVEGDKTRTGYGNDLLSGSKSVKRILCPTQNAYDNYNNILRICLQQEKNILFLLSLGPTAKVLAYDLIINGYQAVDIGQIDMDYDAFINGSSVRLPNPYKYISQLPPTPVLEINDKHYLEQIIARIE